MKILLTGAGAVLVLCALLTAVQVWQTGPGGWDGRDMDDILGVRAGQASPADVDRLSRSDVMQLFHAADAPAFGRMNGEYRARLVPAGILALANEYYAHHWMGPGRWEGKAFFPSGKDAGEGYNLFTVGRGAEARTVRTMQMDTALGKSRFDGKDSFHLVYAAHNRGRNRSMRDEIRRINDSLYIGLGYVSWNLGKRNPSFFLLHGSPDPWVGPDAD